MTQSSRGVFLSYASEDSGPAKRICDALRAAGVDVWIDQAELRGGDAWDQKIRQQIRDCALFVPIVSAHTQARPEGYFRLEWKLAVDRSHLMAAEKAFLVPVVVDATTEAEALVPAQFREVQWTSIQAGEVQAGFVDRIAALLNQPVAPRVGSREQGVSRAPPRRLPIALIVLSVAAVVALVIATAMRGGRLPHKPPPKVEVVASSASVAITPAAISEKSVAVLPFVDMSEKKDQEYFSDGLSEELIDMLTKVPDLRVPARTSSFYFKGKQTTIAEIAKALGVSHLLEGSVRRSGNRVRVTAQLVRADNGYHLWSQTYDRAFDDIFKIQDEIAAAVVKALKVSLLTGARPMASGTTNSEAYTLFLQARAIFQRGTAADYEKAYEYLRQAVRLDPGFASAWAEMARIRVRQDWAGAVPRPQAIADAHHAAEKALALDGSLAEAHLSMGRVLSQLDWDWAAAQSEFKHAIELDPGDGEAYRWAGNLAQIFGRFDEAMDLYQRAIERDPLEPMTYLSIAGTHYASGRLSAAETACMRAQDLNPAMVRCASFIAQLRLIQGDPAGAVNVISGEPGPHFFIPALAYHALGRKGDSDAALAAFEKESGAEDPYQAAQMHAFRGERDKAFEWLGRALKQHDFQLRWIKGDPLLRNIELDPRYKAFLSEMKLPQ